MERMRVEEMDGMVRTRRRNERAGLLACLIKGLIKLLATAKTNEKIPILAESLATFALDPAAHAHQLSYCSLL